MLEADAPEATRFADLDGDRHDRLRGCGAPVPARLLATNIGLVDLDLADQSLSPRRHHRLAVAMQHRPRRLVGAQPQHTLEPQRRDPVLLAGQLPRSRKPHRQRRPGPMKDRARSHRRLVAASRTLTPAAGQPPPAPTRARWTAPTARPPQPIQIVKARLIVRKPRQQLRIVPARHNRRHPPTLPGSDGYPVHHYG